MMLGSRSRIEQIRRGQLPIQGLQLEIDRIQKALQGNKPIKALAGTEGWQEIETDLVQRIIPKLRGLCRAIIEERWVEVIADAHFIENANMILGLVNETLLQSAISDKLIHSYINVQERLEEEEQARQR